MLATNFQSFSFHASDAVDAMCACLSELEKLRFKAFKLMKEHRSEKVVARLCKKDVRWVRSTLGRFNELGHFRNRAGQGRKPKLSEADVRCLVKKVKGKPKASTRKTSKTFKTR